MPSRGEMVGYLFVHLMDMFFLVGFMITNKT